MPAHLENTGRYFSKRYIIGIAIDTSMTTGETAAILAVTIFQIVFSVFLLDKM
jgi:hypothetical protein